MMTVEPLTVDHLLAMDKPGHDAKVTTTGAVGWALIVDGKPMAAAGLVPAFEHTAYAWAMFTDEARQSALIMRRAHWAIRQMLSTTRDKLGLERIQADAEAGQPCAWLERLGFQFEGLMAKYCEGRTFARYAWVRD